MQKYTIYLPDDVAGEIDKAIADTKDSNRASGTGPGNIGKGKIIAEAWQELKDLRRMTSKLK